ncbi:uncharacterized protein TRIADDRAFT_64021 [Trichoplax adhaerens]|uniref:Cellular tumor antigen p53 n=1 Tax=Trichoplax adhaerens TaxID=10228 RepID=B3RZS6_TRIAD|nr:hypothetical protein TRIADDRAFT_64021 [Trichoplax adhaerens]EDV24258.1 hypothetical protein TRIADDRAFT_64021 [Trichoplax adhaerens]|eukprot:XP_002113784.1 hypothetical protein TRIADDRAFT_64021 [Trichoplax adhaerens]
MSDEPTLSQLSFSQELSSSWQLMIDEITQGKFNTNEDEGTAIYSYSEQNPDDRYLMRPNEPQYISAGYPDGQVGQLPREFAVNQIPSPRTFSDNVSSSADKAREAYYGQAVNGVSAETSPPLKRDPSLPSNAEYIGNFGFDIAIDQNDNPTKATNNTYSTMLKKLFIKMECLFPIHITIERMDYTFKIAYGSLATRRNCNQLIIPGEPPANSYIRAYVMYTKPQDVYEPVRRCPNHALRDQGKYESSDHILRCESQRAEYYEDTSGRHSVRVPYTAPAVGELRSTLLYQFMCFSSCSGSINRRPIELVITLENGTNVLGRKKVEVRVCACPGRDRSNEERAAMKSEKEHKQPPNKKLKTSKTVSREVTGVISNESKRIMKRSVESTSNDDVFTITVRGRKNYEILAKMSESLEVLDKLSDAQINEIKSHGTLTAPLERTNTEELVRRQSRNLDTLQNAVTTKENSDGADLNLSISRWLSNINMEKYTQEFIKHGFKVCGHLANVSYSDMKKIIKNMEDCKKISAYLLESNFSSGNEEDIPCSQIGNSFRASQMSMNSTASQELDITRFTLRQTITL